MYLSQWFDHLTTRRGHEPEAVRAAFARAGQATLRALFGADTPARCAVEEIDQRFSLTLQIVDHVPQVPDQLEYRALLEACQRALADDPDPWLRSHLKRFASCEEGDELSLPLDWTVPGARRLKGLEQALEGCLPHGLQHRDFWHQRERDLTAAIDRLDPPRSWPTGSAGQLLRDGGGWLRGSTGTTDALSLCIVGARFERIATAPSFSSYTLQVQLSAERPGIRQLAPLRLELQDNSGNLDRWLGQRLDPGRRPQVEQQLAGFAEHLASQLEAHPERAPRPAHRSLQKLLVTAQPGFPEGSLARWCRDVLLPALATGNESALQLSDPILVERSRWERGCGFVQAHHPQIQRDRGELFLGRLDPEDAALPAPDEATAALLLSWVGPFRAQLLDELSQRAKTQQPPAALWGGLLPCLPLLALVRARVQLGPPPPAPLPLPDIERGVPLDAPSDEDRARVAAALGNATARAVWIFRAGAWLIVVRDSTERAPHSAAHLSLLSPGDRLITVQSCDVWSASNRFCLGGDAFAFRRLRQWLLTWLAARPELDEPGIFTDEDAEEPESPAEDQPLRLSIRPSRWLLYDRYEQDDRYLLDWRVQSGVVPAGRRIADSAPLYGFSAQTMERLEGGSDEALLHRFLHTILPSDSAS